MIGFNYRRVPAVVLARQLVADGRIGQIRHVRASYLQDWLVDPASPLTWRLQRERAGSGALGDLGAHIVDLAQYLTGELVTGVSAVTTTFVGERPREAGGGSGPVTVDDAAVFTARLGAATLATFEATRFATGHKNQLRIELNGERGSLVFDLERLNELGFTTTPTTQPRRASARSWSPSPITRTCPPGGRRATCSAGSTPSPMRSGTW